MARAWRSPGARPASNRQPLRWRSRVASAANMTPPDASIVLIRRMSSTSATRSADSTSTSRRNLSALPKNSAPSSSSSTIRCRCAARCASCAAPQMRREGRSAPVHCERTSERFIAWMKASIDSSTPNATATAKPHSSIAMQTADMTARLPRARLLRSPLHHARATLRVHWSASATATITIIPASTARGSRESTSPASARADSKSSTAIAAGRPP